VTPWEKRRLDEECHILAGDPLAAAEVVPVATAAARNNDIVVIRGLSLFTSRAAVRQWTQLVNLKFAIILCDITDGV
jgi:hypothetical protein